MVTESYFVSDSSNGEDLVGALSSRKLAGCLDGLDEYAIDNDDACEQNPAKTYYFWITE